MPTTTKKKQNRRRPRLHAGFYSALSVLAPILAAALLLGLGLLRGGASAGVDGADTSLDLPVNTRKAEDFTRENDVISYPGAELGVDVSAHQGEIDWQRVKQAGVTFAILRIGYRGYTVGSLNEDSTFRANLDGALAAGLELGVYFYSQATSEDEAREEADFVLLLLNGRSLACPVFFDWEEVRDEESRTRGRATSEVAAYAAAFCERIEAAGYRAGVYFNQRYGYSIMRLKTLSRYEFWLAEYDDAPSFLYDFRYWQYTGSGQIDGIDADVDVDLRFAAAPEKGGNGS